MAGIRLEFAQFGNFDTFDIIRSTTSMASVADADLPSPIATGITKMYYVDTSIAAGINYYYKIRVNRSSDSFVSNEINAKYVGVWLPLTTDLTDNTGKTWTAYGGASVVSGALTLVRVSGQRIDTPYNADFHFSNSEDVVIRFKFKTATFGSDRRVLVTTRRDTSGARNWATYANADGSIVLFAWDTGGAVINMSIPAFWVADTEHEVSFERKTMAWTCYKDGTKIGSTYNQSANYTVETSSYLTIGSEFNIDGSADHSRDLDGTFTNLQILFQTLGDGSTTPRI